MKGKEGWTKVNEERGSEVTGVGSREAGGTDDPGEGVGRGPTVHVRVFPGLPRNNRVGGDGRRGRDPSVIRFLLDPRDPRSPVVPLLLPLSWTEGL